MNILILNWRDPKHPLAGGAEIMMWEHAQYWKEKGATITWLAASFKGAKQEEILDGIHVLRKGSHYTVHFYFMLSAFLGKFYSIDLVIDCFHFIPFFTPIFLSNKKKIAVIHEVAKEVWFKNVPFIFAVIGASVEKLFFTFYKDMTFITVSESTKKDLQSVDIPAEHIQVIVNGIRLPKIKKTAKAKNPIVLFLGRIASDKGVQDAIAAYESIYMHNPNVSLWIIGKEQESGYVNKLLRHTKGEIRYLGFVSEQKKYELMQKARILVHPSTREGWGLTVIEANSVGLPVVGYNVSGLKDSIQNKKTGLLVDTNPKALAEGVTTLLTDEKFYKRLSDNAKIWARQFNWKKSAQKSWEILQK